MTVEYKRLWKLLIDKNMKKKTLIEQAHLNNSAMDKMLHDKPVHLSLLMRICEVLGCGLDDVVELIPTQEPPR